jgi:4-aminobutyrate aminotransferase-like enzyme
MGDRLRVGLDALKERYAVVGDVRGMGLMQAIELVADEKAGDRRPHPKAANALLEETRRRGLLIGKGGLWGNVMRIAPPMSVSAEQVDRAVGLIGESLEATRGVAL